MRRAKLPILCLSSKCFGVTNGSFSHGWHVTVLPFANLSTHATQAGSFDDFPNSLISVGHLANDNTISIFTQDGVTVHKEQDVLITCCGDPVLIGVSDKHGHSRAPLIQTKGHWRPRLPKNASLPSCMKPTTCMTSPQLSKLFIGCMNYPVKSTWLKAVKASKFVGWPLLIEKNIEKYFPDTPETQHGHMAQTQKNIRSMKRSSCVFEKTIIASLRGKKERNLYTAFYDVHKTTLENWLFSYAIAMWQQIHHGNG
eukprot:CCRYP_003321-RA/>CCRYP_003321-RA protein AED:0.39 eAED:0.42 QI:0/0/0/1/0/0/2/0/254